MILDLCFFYKMPSCLSSFHSTHYTKIFSLPSNLVYQKNDFFKSILLFLKMIKWNSLFCPKHKDMWWYLMPQPSKKSPHLIWECGTPWINSSQFCFKNTVVMNHLSYHRPPTALLTFAQNIKTFFPLCSTQQWKNVSCIVAHCSVNSHSQMLHLYTWIITVYSFSVQICHSWEESVIHASC